MIGDHYWDVRLHRWGAWLATGSGRMSSTPLARMRELGVRVSGAQEHDAPFVHEAERETDAMVHALQRRTRAVLDAYYRQQTSIAELAVKHEMHPDTVRAWIREAHKRMQRQLSERRRGGPRPAGRKAVSVHGEAARGRGRTLASVVPEE